jgi:hypothetical protein
MLTLINTEIKQVLSSWDFFFPLRKQDKNGTGFEKLLEIRSLH